MTVDDVIAGHRDAQPVAHHGHEFTLEGSHDFAKMIILENGAPMEIEAFQERFLASVFDGNA